ncbi:MAG: hypothetical protein M3O02_11120 [Acidobacteriota bacterium]|nr:hypothetical protein [Acidobacteriota bacterium]
MGQGLRTQEQGIRIRDIRQTNWFWVDNVLVDVFLPLIGPLGSTVYQTLVREAGRSRRLRTQLGQHQVDLTLREIGELSGVSKDTAARLLWRMQVLRMIDEDREASGRRAVYQLNNLQDAAAPGPLELQRRLHAAEVERTGKPAAKPRPKVEENERGMLLFDDGEGQESERAAADTHAEEIRDAGNNHGQAPAEDAEFVSQGDKVGDDEAKRLSQKPGGLVSQGDSFVSGRDVFVSHGDPLSIQEKETNTEYQTLLNPPASGRTSEPLRRVLDGLRNLRPRQGDVSDLREQVAEHMRAAGFACVANYRIPDRGDGRGGMLDLVCMRDVAISSLREWLAFEFDGTLPREKTVTKLRRFEGKRVLVLRTAEAHVPMTLDGIDWVIGMGWPGAGFVERNEVALARTRVGMAEPVEPAAEGVREPNAATLREVLGAVHTQIAGMDTYASGGANFLSEYLAEWDAAMQGIEYERHELPEGSSAGILLVLSSPDPAAARRIFAQYEIRLSREMEAVFGARVVQVQVVGREGDAAGGE